MYGAFGTNLEYRGQQVAIVVSHTNELFYQYSIPSPKLCFDFSRHHASLALFKAGERVFESYGLHEFCEMRFHLIDSSQTGGIRTLTCRAFGHNTPARKKISKESDTYDGRERQFSPLTSYVSGGYERYPGVTPESRGSMAS
jgi:hypothetical protein